LYIIFFNIQNGRSTPTPDKNYFIQFILAKHVYKNKLHIQDKNIINSWEQYAISFSQLSDIKQYEQIKGQSGIEISMNGVYERKEKN
jgi:hypothetical protein